MKFKFFVQIFNQNVHSTSTSTKTKMLKFSQKHLTIKNNVFYFGMNCFCAQMLLIYHLASKTAI